MPDEQESKPNTEQQRRRRDYRSTFTTDAGKRVLKDMMVQHHLLVPSFSESNPHITAFREGQRYVVLQILGLIDHANDPDQILQEHTDGLYQYEPKSTH